MDLEEEELSAEKANKEFSQDKVELLYDVRVALEGDKSAIFFLKESIMKDDESYIEEIRETFKIESAKKIKIERSL